MLSLSLYTMISMQSGRFQYRWSAVHIKALDCRSLLMALKGQKVTSN